MKNEAYPGQSAPEGERAASHLDRLLRGKETREQRIPLDSLSFAPTMIVDKSMIAQRLDEIYKRIAVPVVAVRERTIEGQTPFQVLLNPHTALAMKQRGTRDVQVDVYPEGQISDEEFFDIQLAAAVAPDANPRFRFAQVGLNLMAAYELTEAARLGVGLAEAAEWTRTDVTDAILTHPLNPEQLAKVKEWMTKKAELCNTSVSSLHNNLISTAVKADPQILKEVRNPGRGMHIPSGEITPDQLDVVVHRFSDFITQRKILTVATDYSLSPRALREFFGGKMLEIATEFSLNPEAITVLVGEGVDPLRTHVRELTRTVTQLTNQITRLEREKIKKAEFLAGQTKRTNSAEHKLAARDREVERLKAELAQYKKDDGAAALEYRVRELRRKIVRKDETIAEERKRLEEATARIRDLEAQLASRGSVSPEPVDAAPVTPPKPKIIVLAALVHAAKEPAIQSAPKPTPEKPPVPATSTEPVIPKPPLRQPEVKEKPKKSASTRTETVVYPENPLLERYKTTHENPSPTHQATSDTTVQVTEDPHAETVPGKFTVMLNPWPHHLLTANEVTSDWFAKKKFSTHDLKIVTEMTKVATRALLNKTRGPGKRNLNPSELQELVNSVQTRKAAGFDAIMTTAADQFAHAAKSLTIGVHDKTFQLMSAEYHLLALKTSKHQAIAAGETEKAETLKGYEELLEDRIYSFITNPKEELYPYAQALVQILLLGSNQDIRTKARTYLTQRTNPEAVLSFVENFITPDTDIYKKDEEEKTAYHFSHLFYNVSGVTKTDHITVVIPPEPIRDIHTDAKEPLRPISNEDIEKKSAVWFQELKKNAPSLIPIIARSAARILGAKLEEKTKQYLEIQANEKSYSGEEAIMKKIVPSILTITQALEWEEDERFDSLCATFYSTFFKEVARVKKRQQKEFPHELATQLDEKVSDSLQKLNAHDQKIVTYLSTVPALTALNRQRIMVKLREQGKNYTPPAH